MRIRLETDALAEAVAWVARSLPNRPSLPILAGILITASKDKVVLSSFDNTTAAKAVLVADVEQEGQALVSGRLLNEISRSLPRHPVELIADINKVDLTCGSARFTLQTLPVEEYPTLPTKPKASGDVDAKTFEKAVSQVFVAAGRDELLPVFTGVLFEIHGDQLSLLATDRYRMALKEINWNPLNPQMEGMALVPGKVLSEITKSISVGKKVHISLAGSDNGEGLVGFEGETTSGLNETVTRLLDGNFPKVRHLMNVDPSVTVRISREELLAAVKRVSLVAERNSPLRMEIGPDQVSLTAATGDQAQASEAIEAQVDVFDGELALTAAGFNPHYLLDALSSFDVPYINFAFKAAGQPCLLTGLKSLDGEQLVDYRHVIMLMRLPN